MQFKFGNSIFKVRQYFSTHSEFIESSYWKPHAACNLDIYRRIAASPHQLPLPVSKQHSTQLNTRRRTPLLYVKTHPEAMQLPIPPNGLHIQDADHEPWVIVTVESVGSPHSLQAQHLTTFIESKAT